MSEIESARRELQAAIDAHAPYEHIDAWRARVARLEAVEQNGTLAPRTLVHLPGVIHLYGSREGVTVCGESTWGSTVTLSREPVTCSACEAHEQNRAVSLVERDANRCAVSAMLGEG